MSQHVILETNPNLRMHVKWVTLAISQYQFIVLVSSWS